MILQIKNQGGYPLPETTIKNKAEHEDSLMKKGFKKLFIN